MTKRTHKFERPRGQNTRYQEGRTSCQQAFSIVLQVIPECQHLNSQDDLSFHHQSSVVYKTLDIKD